MKRRKTYNLPNRSVYSEANLDNRTGPAQICEDTDMSQVAVNINGKTQWIETETVAQPLFRTYAEDYLSLYKANGSIQKNTLIGYNGYMHNHLLPYFGDLRLSEITPNKLQAYINLKSKQYTAKTISEHINLLRPILDAAVEDGFIALNPCNSQRIKLIGRKSEKVTAYTEDEFRELERLLQYLDGTSKLFLALSLYTGMRQGEMFALQWTDIDLLHSCISVTKSVEWPAKNKGEIKEPKTENGYRTIFIVPQLHAILSSSCCKEGYVLVTARQSKSEPASHQAVKRLNDRVNDTAKANGIGVRFLSHRARHTVATFMNNAGVDDVTITHTLGHSDVSFTKRQYMNHQARQVQRGMDRFSQYLTSFDQ